MAKSNPPQTSMFQFLPGAIITDVVCVRETIPYVSIPPWCDYNPLVAPIPAMNYGFQFLPGAIITGAV